MKITSDQELKFFPSIPSARIITESLSGSTSTLQHSIIPTLYPSRSHPLGTWAFNKYNMLISISGPPHYFIALHQLHGGGSPPQKN
jgi:hypothetical protein